MPESVNSWTPNPSSAGQVFHAYPQPDILTCGRRSAPIRGGDVLKSYSRVGELGRGAIEFRKIQSGGSGFVSNLPAASRNCKKVRAI